MDSLLSAAGDAAVKFPLLHDYENKPLAYGTAGFRTEGVIIPPLAARIVFIVQLRLWWGNQHNVNQHINGGVSLGLMVTASHNPPRDNGLKVVDYNAEMLEDKWEVWCGRAANAAGAEDLITVLQECASCFKITPPETSVNNCCSNIQLGRDTRRSGQAILDCVTDTLSLLGCSFCDHGIITTPQLHFLVKEASYNESLSHDGGRLSVNLYYQTITNSFNALTKLLDLPVPEQPKTIVVDVANGVGFHGLCELAEYSKSTETDTLGKYFRFTLLNTEVDNDDRLNKECGADYVKVSGTPSSSMKEWCESSLEKEPLPHLYCLDGDADRLVALYHSDPHTYSLLDGDRICILYAQLLRCCLGPAADRLDIVVVQTGYANGASTHFVKNKLLLPCQRSNTGIKFLHEIAKHHDIGVYFEANGHGTILVNMAQCVKSFEGLAKGEMERFTSILKGIQSLASQVCGDAIADLLLCELALAATDLTWKQWSETYTDFPAQLFKLSVRHPSRIRTNPSNETIVEQPEGLQEELNAAVREVRCSPETARAFVRPSGTEPVVRIYAECANAEDCDALAASIESIVKSFCDTDESF